MYDWAHHEIEVNWFLGIRHVLEGGQVCKLLSVAENPHGYSSALYCWLCFD